MFVLEFEIFQSRLSPIASSASVHLGNILEVSKIFSTQNGSVNLSRFRSPTTRARKHFVFQFPTRWEVSTRKYLQ